MYLALANLLHHKVRSVLSALAVGIGVAMLVTLLGLTHGSLEEISTRGLAIDADLMVMPSESSLTSGRPFTDAHVARAAELRGPAGNPLITRIAPVLQLYGPINRLSAERKSKEGQRIFGIRPDDWSFFCSQPMVRGTMFADSPEQDARLLDLLRRGIDCRDDPAELDDADRATLDAAFVMVIDERLARFAGVDVGDKVEAFGRPFTVVGIAPTGVTVRAFAPLSALRYVLESPGTATFLAVKLSDDAELTAAGKQLAAAIGGNVLTVAEYAGMLTEMLAVVPQYTQITSIVVLTVAFLFVLVIMYTVVIQRTREIGILKSLGAGTGSVIRIVLAESLALSMLGTAAGIGMSFAAAKAILHFKPLLTIDLNPRFILAGVVTGCVGGLLSGLYPALMAAWLDPVTALNYE